MKVLSENFKGIEFIRISNLPDDQKESIEKTIHHDKIINILKDKVVIRDCIQYHDYLAWYTEFKSKAITSAQSISTKRPQPSFKLAFK